MSTPTPPILQVAILLFPGVDILDFAGPLEILSRISHNNNPDAPLPAFRTHLVARTRTVRAGNCMTVTADLTLEEAHAQLSTFDILVVPGGVPAVIAELVESGSGEVGFIGAFGQRLEEGGRGGERGERVLLSVCTGALLVGATGALGGVRATTHHRAQEMLREVCQAAARKGLGEGKAVEVVASKRYVDGGVNGTGIRVVTAGGISCGLDASLYVGSLKTSVGAAEFVARVSEYHWNRE